MLELLKSAKNADIPAKYVLFDSWFSSPKSLHAVKNLGYEVIGMIKKDTKNVLPVQWKICLSLIHIYKKNKKRRGRSRYLLSVEVEVDQGRKIHPRQSRICPQPE